MNQLSPQVLRLLDANFNRAREALRVIEDYARFVLNDGAISSGLKQIRHDLVNATMEYAILERADVVLNIGRHDFSILIPAIAESARRDAGRNSHLATEMRGTTDKVVCDVHLLESAYKNLLYNAMRFAKQEVRVTFEAGDSINRLTVEDDGPGIPAEDRDRIFGSFVQLQRSGEMKRGFGLGLAIVKRVMEWHNGNVAVDTSPLGGARFTASWPG